MSNMYEILQKTRDLVATKKAEFKSNLAGDEKVADKELDMSGAGDDSPITRGHALEADQAALEPTKEPLESGDAMAEPSSGGSGTTGEAEGEDEGNETDRADKLESEDAAPVSLTKKPAVSGDAYAKVAEGEDGAAKLANDILTSVRAYQTEKKEAAAPAVEAPETKKAAPAATPAVEAPEAKKAEAEPVVEAPVAGKQAEIPDLQLTTDVLAKIAAMTLSTEEGVTFVEDLLAKTAGAEAAEETLGFLAEQSELAEKQSAFDAGAQDADALVAQAIFNAGLEAGQQGKTAEQAQEALYKLGQAMADASIADLMGGGGPGAGAPPPAMGAEMAPPPMDVPPEALAAEEGAPVVEEEAAGGEEGVTPEELDQALDALVQEGTIAPEEAQAVKDYMASAETGEVAADEGAAEADAAVAGQEEEAGAAEAAEAAPEEQPPMEAAAESKPVDKAAALLQVIREAKAKRS